MYDVLIFRPIKSPLQSGRGRLQKWQMLFCHTPAQGIDPVLRSLTQKDSKETLKLYFDSLQDARAYAHTHGLNAHVQQTPPVAPLHPHSYTEHLLKPHLRS